MIVIDASVAVGALLGQQPARSLLADEELCAPHLIDSEVLDAFRKLVLRDAVPETAAQRALTVWASLGIARYPVIGLTTRVWELRPNLTAYDAAYVALAEALGCRLVTADARLAGATGPRCPIEIVPG